MASSPVIRIPATAPQTGLPSPGRTPLTIATNVSRLDLHRARHIIPTWFSSFPDWELRIVIVLDLGEVEGRLRQEHKVQFDAEPLQAELRALAARDSRVTVKILDHQAWPDISRRWYGRVIEKRDHGGTANFAYLYALENSGGGPVLKSDSDILYHDRGWLAAGLSALADGKADLVFPPRPGPSTFLTSSRSYLINPDTFRRFLPLPVLRGSLPFRVKRWFRRRNTFLGLENVYLHLHERGRVRAELLPRELGATLHVWSPYIPAQPYFPELAARFVRGDIPAAQEETWECEPERWGFPRFVAPA